MSRVGDILADPCMRLGINCHACGLFRLIPEDLKVGESFYLVPCPKCHSVPLSLRLTDDGVQEVIH